MSSERAADRPSPPHPDLMGKIECSAQQAQRKGQTPS